MRRVHRSRERRRGKRESRYHLMVPFRRSTALLLFAAATGACGFLFDDDGFTSGAADAGGDVSESGPAEAAAGDPKVVVVASGQVRPHWIVQDEDAVYWVNEGAATDAGKSSQVVRLGRRGGEEPRVIVTGILTALDLAQDLTSLFWVEGLGGCTAGTGIGTVEKSGAQRKSSAAACYRHLGVRADATDLYIIRADGALVRSAKNETVTDLAPLDRSTAAIALGSRHVYTASATTRSITQTDKATSAASQRLFAAEQDTARAIVTDATHVYWVTGPLGTVARLAHDAAGTAPQVLANMQAQPLALAIDSTAVYFVNAGDGTINRVDKTGGNVVELARAKEPCGIAADDAAVYFSDCSGGTVTRIAR